MDDFHPLDFDSNGFDVINLKKKEIPRKNLCENVTGTYGRGTYVKHIRNTSYSRENGNFLTVT